MYSEVFFYICVKPNLLLLLKMYDDITIKKIRETFKFFHANVFYISKECFAYLGYLHKIYLSNSVAIEKSVYKILLVLKALIVATDRANFLGKTNILRLVKNTNII